MPSQNVLQPVYIENRTNYIIKIIVRPVAKRRLAFIKCPVNIVKCYLLHCLRPEWEEYRVI